MKAAVIGSGSWGTALARLLHVNGHSVNLWSYDKAESERLASDRENKEFLPGVKLGEGISLTHDMQETLTGAEYVVNVVPSKFVKATAELIKSAGIRKGAVIVNASKGLEEEQLKRLSEVISSALPSNPVVVLSGPSHAEEVSRDIPTACVAACADEDSAKRVQDLFMNNNFRVYTNTDVVGVELGGALKNVIALAAGISDGMGFGDNTKAALMTRGIAEISRLGVAMGGDALTFAGLAGVGDLIVTCTSMHSRNRRAGILLGQGKNIDEALSTVHMVVEGVNTAKAAYELSIKHSVSMPITKGINEMLFHGKPPGQVVCDLMSRDKREE